MYSGQGLIPVSYTHLDVYKRQASFLTGMEVTGVESAKLAASDLLSRGVKAVVIKLGAGGVVYSEQGSFGFVPGHSVQVVDTTAAGDAFSGGLAVAPVSYTHLDVYKRQFYEYGREPSRFHWQSGGRGPVLPHS